MNIVLIALRRSAERIVSKEPVTIDILNKNQRANHAQIQEMENQLTCRRPTLEEFIIRLGRDPKFYEKSKGDWYWLRDEPGLSISGHCRINYEMGIVESVSEVAWNNLLPEYRAYVNKGNGPLAICVSYEAVAWRLFIGTIYKPSDAARVALVSLAESEANEPKIVESGVIIPVEVFHAMRQEVVKINGLADPEHITTLRKVFRI